MTKSNQQTYREACEKLYDEWEKIRVVLYDECEKSRVFYFIVKKIFRINLRTFNNMKGMEVAIKNVKVAIGNSLLPAIDDIEWLQEDDKNQGPLCMDLN